MKNLVFGLVATVLACNLMVGQNLNEKIKDLETTTQSLLQNTEKLDLVNVKSANNDYDDKGLEVYNSIIKVKEIIADQKKSASNYEDVKVLIDNLQSRLSFKNITLNVQEKWLFDSFVKNLSFDTSIVKAKYYENFVNENLKPSEVKNFLIILSEFKYSCYAQKRQRTLSGFESCVDRCMDRTFSNYNAVDWFIFVAGNPGRGVLQVFASCSWECW